MKVVLDASIGVKWFKYENEDNVGLAIKKLQRKHLQDEIEIIVPDLFFYEIMNTLLNKKYFSVDDVCSASESLHCLNMKVICPDKEIIDNAVYITDKTKLTFYGSLYIAVAINKQALLLSEDWEMLQNKDNFNFIKSLKEFH